MRRIWFWILPVFIAAILVLVLVGDVVRLLQKAEPLKVTIPLTGHLDFFAAEPIIDLTRRSGEKEPPFEPWSGLVLGNGWTGMAAGGTWVVGDEADLWFQSVAEPATAIEFECRPFPALPGPQRISFELNGHDLGEIEPRRGLHDYRVKIPPGVVQLGANHLILRFRHHRSPLDAGRGTDARSLAAGFKSLALVTGEGLPRPSLPRIEEDGEAVVIPRPGRLMVPFSSPDPVSLINVGYTFRRHKTENGRRLHFKLWALRGGDAELLDEKSLDEANSNHGRVQLRAGGHSGSLLLSSRLEGPRQVAGVILRRPWMMVSPDNPSWSERLGLQDLSSARSRRYRADQPDIVMIILDAARADHFGVAGHHRDTTPEIDRVARTSLVFEQVRAQAPYTQCSMATMLTGVSWVRHQVIESGNVVPESMTTLAEHLSAAGYRTVGISASPWNSIGVGLAQGYDEFVEVWDGVPFDLAVDAEHLADLVEEQLVGDQDERPLFLMLHLVPPHEPYTPTAAHDLYGDPAYEGPCDGRREYLRDVHRGRQKPNSADMAELDALYDGNLHAADAAVGRIVSALVKHRRPSETLLVITADHGEAFFEHGKRGHNTTIYDEMLRVPLILRLPGGEQPTATSRSRPASLEDLAPTILAAIGIEPPEQMTGVDLLEPEADEPRSIFLRTAPGRVVFAVQRGSFKALADSPGVIRELYDLSDDPGESVNLAPHRPLVMVMLSHLIGVELALAHDRAQVERPVSETEAEMLRKLGYVLD